MNSEKTAVIVRRSVKDEGVFVLFPEIPADVDGFFCTVYDQVCGHGAADLYHCMANSRPVRDVDVLSNTFSLLKFIGYKDLVLHSRPTSAMMRKFLEETKRNHDLLVENPLEISPIV